MNFFERELKDLKNKGLYRSLRTIGGAQGSRVRLEGREVLLLCSNDYLGLANHPKVKAAAVKAIERYGLGAGASRLVSGTMIPHAELEGRIAAFKGAQSAILFNSGYAANTGIIPALAGRGDIIYSDRLNHASMVDGCLLSRADVKRYRHRDLNDLERLLKKSPPSENDMVKRLIVTDGVFSMDGDIAPLREMASLSEKYGAMLMVDDAHGTGALGNKGRGTAEHLSVRAESITVQMGTLGKALGAYGAYVAGSRDLIDYLINKVRPFIYSTALPPCVAAAAIAALDIVEQEPELRTALKGNARYMRAGLNDLGFDTIGSETQIIPVMIGDSDRAVEMMDNLLDEGIFVQAIRPPTVPEGTARLRVTVMASHTVEDLNRALDGFKKAGRMLGLT